MVTTTTALALFNYKNPKRAIRPISIRYSLNSKTTIPMAKTTKKMIFYLQSPKADGLHLLMCPHSGANVKEMINSVSRHYKIEEIMKIIPRQNIIIRKQIGARWCWAGNGSSRKTTPKEIGTKGIAVMTIIAMRKGTSNHHNSTNNKVSSQHGGSGSSGISSWECMAWRR